MPPDGTGPLWRVLGCLGDSPRKCKNGYEARCPAHEDRQRSLSIGLGDDGRVLLSCHAGCATDLVLSRLGLDFSDLFEKSAEGNPVRRFRLLGTNGSVVAEHVREDRPEGKRIWWEHNGKRGLNGTAVADVPLYHGQAIADTNGPIVLCEGEQAAQALIDLGVLAAATVTGANGTPSDEVLSVLQGREVWLWPDNDDVGREHMARIATKLKPAPRWINWPDAPPHGDAYDYVVSGGSAAGLQGLLVVKEVPQAGPRIWTAPELAAQRFDAVRWAIPTLLPAGLAILAGRPKLGKSWLGLGWAIDVARGEKVLGKIGTEPGETLYLALEDGPQRMQERIALMLGDSAQPARMRIATEWPRMDEGGLDLLEAELQTHLATRLIIVDTFKRVRPKEKNTQRLYDLDYDAIAPLAALARAYNVAIVVVFHTRKGESSDPLEMVSGTLGLSGAADCVLVLQRERGQADASLFVTGRDVEEQDLALKWEKDDVLAWKLLGQAEDFRRSKERQAILDTIGVMPGLGPTEIADALGRTRGSVRYLLFAMVRDAEIRTRGGKYFPSSRTGFSTTPLTPLTPSAPNQPRVSSPSGYSSMHSDRGVRGRGQFCGFCGGIHTLDYVCEAPGAEPKDA